MKKSHLVRRTLTLYNLEHKLLELSSAAQRCSFHANGASASDMQLDTF